VNDNFIALYTRAHERFNSILKNSAYTIHFQKKHPENDRYCPEKNTRRYHIARESTKKATPCSGMLIGQDR
jgi:hypothetical protein